MQHPNENQAEIVPKKKNPSALKINFVSIIMGGDKDEMQQRKSDFYLFVKLSSDSWLVLL